MVKFCIDRLVKGKAYPNLATLNATPYTHKWREFSINPPYSEPLMLMEYMDEHDINYDIISMDDADDRTFYPIALSFFDFSIQWFDLMSSELLINLKEKNIKILFYYSEGDNPHIINEHITLQCLDNNIPREQILFISANSEAKNIKHFIHTIDDELLFKFRNSKIPPFEYSEHLRDKKYTALVRMHKLWRANTMATLWQKRLDTDGYFGYGNTTTSGESEDDNPIEVDNYFGLRQLTKTFMTTIPFVADNLSDADHNDHTLHVSMHFENSYINVVLESHMDVDQSGGVFLTEKTFKPIKHSQMFIIFGACGSLQLLRDMGYKTFDHVLDNRYDMIENTTERWKTTMDSISSILERTKSEIHKMYTDCKDDIIHNHTLFNSSKLPRLEKLLKEIQK